MLGKRLRELRIEKGYTLAFVANKIGVSEATLSNYEKASRKPDWEVISKLADFYNVSTDYLLGRTDIKSSVEQIVANKNNNEKFTSAEEAVDYILNDNLILGLGGFDIDKLSDEEKIEYANELYHQMELVGYKFKKD